ncbi:MAG: hypothetical protein HKN24_11575 [Acidimicrobiales bacterium]|nr:hypothetical protein [Acidimicrobiales bacterium]
MMYAYVVTWKSTIPGREQLSLDYGLEVAEYWGKLAADGKCTEPEMFFFPDGHGMWMVKGEFETLQQLWMTDEGQHLLIKGRYLLEDFGYEFARTGDAADQYLMFFAEVGKELAFS